MLRKHRARSFVLSQPRTIFYFSSKLMEEKYITGKSKKNIRKRWNFNRISIQNLVIVKRTFQVHGISQLDSTVKGNVVKQWDGVRRKA